MIEIRSALRNVALEELMRRALNVIIIGSGLLFFWIISGSPWRRLGDARWPFSILVVATLASIIVYLFHRRSIYRALYPRAYFQYDILNKKIVFRITEQDTLEYSRLYRIKVRRSQLEDFIDRYIWTGGTSPLPIPGKNVSRIEVLDRVGIWTYVKVSFGRTLERGQEYEFEISWPPITNWRTASPFVSTSTEEPTREINFVLALPAREVGTNLLGEVMRGIESIYPFKTYEFKMDDGRYTWTIRKPPLYRHYRLRWNWTGGSVTPVKKTLEQASQANVGGEQTER